MLRSKFRLMELFCFVLALLIMRIALILFPFERIYADSDELSRGALAKEIMGKPMLPIFDYLDGDAELYEGGRLVFSLVTVPFFRIFGDSYFSLKLVAIFFSVITLICWWFFLVKFFSIFAARWFAFLFLFSPPLYTVASLVSWGAHADFYFFVPILFYLFYSLYFEETSINKACKLWAVFGLVSGAAVWIGQVNVLVLATSWLILLARKKHIGELRNYLIYAIFFILGYSLGFWHFFTRHWRRGLASDSIFTHFLTGSHPFLWPNNFFSFILKDMPESFLFPWPWVSYVYYLTFLFFTALYVWINRYQFFKLRQRKAAFLTPLIIYLLLYVIVYVIGDFQVTPEHGGFQNYYYTSVLFPVIFAVLAVFAARNKAIIIRILKCVLIGLSAAGFLGYLSLIPWHGFGATYKEQGYSYFNLGDRLPWGLTKEGLKSLFSNLRNLDSYYAPDFLLGIANGVAFNEYINEDVKSVYALFNSVPENLRAHLYQGWGKGLNDPFLSEYSKAERILGSVILCTEDKYEKVFYFALGEGIIANAVKIQDVKDVLLFAEGKLSESQWRYFYEGTQIGIKEREFADYLYLKELLGHYAEK